MAYSQKTESFANTFVIKEVNDSGIMAFNVYIRGMPHVVTIDDTIPFVSYKKKLIPAFAQIGMDGALHGPLLEKLWAKINGCYERTAAGWQHESLRILSGAPAYDYLCSSYTALEIFKLLSEGHSKGFICGAGTAGSGNDEVLTEIGLSESHAYALLGTFELKND